MKTLLCGIVLSFSLTGLAVGLEPGHARGALTVDGKSTPLEFAVTYETEDLFDPARKNTAVVITDVVLDDVSATDDWELAQRAGRGELTVLVLRLSGDKVVHVRVNHAGVEGTVLLPVPWFAYRPGSAAGQTAGTLKWEEREYDGHTYAGSVEFLAGPAPVVETEPEPEPELAPPPAPEAEPIPASASRVDPDSLTPLVIRAIMEKDEAQAIKLLKVGANPNGRDQYGIALLNWAVMTCLPNLVQSLVDAGADLTYQRAPGMTLLQEAGACPAAEKILRAAGAR